MYTRSLNFEAHTDFIEVKAELNSSCFIPNDINLFFNFKVSGFSTNFIFNVKFLHFSRRSLIISGFRANFIFVIYSSISSFISLFSTKDKKY